MSWRTPWWLCVTIVLVGCLVDFDAGLIDRKDAAGPACGAVGAPCCSGDTCNEGNCVAGVCQRCGGVGQVCCAGRQCAEGLCTGAGDGTCVSCGAAGEACCVGNACSGGGCCVAATCIAVGATCPGLGGVCADGSCGACGGAGAPCCTGDICTGSNLSCVGGDCVPCGGAGEQCCAGDTCETTTLICAAGLCTACGGTGEPCCAGDICNVAGLTCSATKVCEAPPDAGVDSTPPVDGPSADLPAVDCTDWTNWDCSMKVNNSVSRCPATGVQIYSLVCNATGCACTNKITLAGNTCSVSPGITCADAQAAFASGCCSGI